MPDLCGCEMSGGRKARRAKTAAASAVTPVAAPEALAGEIAATMAAVIEAEMALVAQVMGLSAGVAALHPPLSEAEVEEGFDNMPV